MSKGRQAWLSCAALLGALLAVGCGGNAESTEVASGNTNWLKECATDDDCGGLSCACGTCREACDGAIECALEPQRACVGAEVKPQASAPKVHFEDVDPNSYARDLAVDAQGAVLLVGGTDATTFDLSPFYPTFWLAKLDGAGTRLWEYSEPPTDDDSSGNTGLSLALYENGDIVTVSTIYDGLDTPSLRRFDQEGNLLTTESSSPGFKRLVTASGEDFLAAGSTLLETRGGRPFTSAWIGRVGAEGPIWETTRAGRDGSVSDVDVIASDSSGELLVGGSLGTEADSNASVPWLGRLDLDGSFVWEETFAVQRISNCNATATAFTVDGGSLASVSCVGPWVRGYDRTGQVLWQRRFAKTVTALAGLGDGGYAVALGSSDYATGAKGVELLRYDAGHRLLWRTEQSGCYLFERLLATEQGVLALAGCDTGYRLTSYADP